MEWDYRSKGTCVFWCPVYPGHCVLLSAGSFSLLKKLHYHRKTAIVGIVLVLLVYTVNLLGSMVGCYLLNGNKHH